MLKLGKVRSKNKKVIEEKPEIKVVAEIESVEKGKWVDLYPKYILKWNDVKLCFTGVMYKQFKSIIPCRNFLEVGNRKTFKLTLRGHSTKYRLIRIGENNFDLFKFSTD